MIRLLFFFLFLYLTYRLVSRLFRLPPGPGPTPGARGSYTGGRRPPGGASGGGAAAGTPPAAGRMVKCAACGLYVPEENAIKRRRGGETVYFCGSACARKGGAD
ncbi:MAG: hypothetical protein JW781_11530 [Deltaproteobacteria bacterium]|nr:hypothetical protein [Candidatus Anaeroferrophillacea bacterium]